MLPEELALGEGTQFATDGGDLPLWHHHGEGFEVGGGHREDVGSCYIVSTIRNGSFV